MFLFRSEIHLLALMLLAPEKECYNLFDHKFERWFSTIEEPMQMWETNDTAEWWITTTTE